jgi:WNK lysine deficient protein kinase
MKKVYRAYDTTQGVEVAWNAVKVAGMSPAARQRVVQEMKILQTLDHGSIIHVHSSCLNKELESVVLVLYFPGSSSATG